MILLFFFFWLKCWSVLYYFFFLNLPVLSSVFQWQDCNTDSFKNWQMTTFPDNELFFEFLQALWSITHSLALDTGGVTIKYQKDFSTHNHCSDTQCSLLHAVATISYIPAMLPFLKASLEFLQSSHFILISDVDGDLSHCHQVWLWMNSCHLQKSRSILNICNHGVFSFSLSFLT